MSSHPSSKDIVFADLEAAQRFVASLRAKGFHNIAGLDEVGAGAFVGPVVAACVVLPENHGIIGITDSKKLSEKKRDTLFDQIMAKATAWSIQEVSNTVIDEINILEARRLAARNAVEEIVEKIDFLIADGGLSMTGQFLGLQSVSAVKGDLFFEVVGAASILAKVYRDRLISVYDPLWPEYKLAKNKGYGSKEHIDAINTVGITEIHRRSFGVCKTAKMRVD
jgi:ribonuclease HII